jgi:hypothetical protein
MGLARRPSRGEVRTGVPPAAAVEIPAPGIVISSALPKPHRVRASSRVRRVSERRPGPVHPSSGAFAVQRRLEKAVRSGRAGARRMLEDP